MYRITEKSWIGVEQNGAEFTDHVICLSKLLYKIDIVETESLKWLN